MKYIGNDRFIPGIPARDLTDDDLTQLAAKRGKTPTQLRKELTDSGLYSAGKEK
jgi:hypothetical protein